MSTWRLAKYYDFSKGSQNHRLSDYHFIRMALEVTRRQLFSSFKRSLYVKFKDKNIPYMYHCHILEHEDGGMMGQFVVV